MGRGRAALGAEAASGCSEGSDEAQGERALPAEPGRGCCRSCAAGALHFFLSILTSLDPTAPLHHTAALPMRAPHSQAPPLHSQAPYTVADTKRLQQSCHACAYACTIRTGTQHSCRLKAPAAELPCLCLCLHPTHRHSPFTHSCKHRAPAALHGRGWKKKLSLRPLRLLLCGHGRPFRKACMCACVLSGGKGCSVEACMATLSPGVHANVWCEQVCAGLDSHGPRCAWPLGVHGP